MPYCQHCGAPLGGKYCAECGRPAPATADPAPSVGERALGTLGIILGALVLGVVLILVVPPASQEVLARLAPTAMPIPTPTPIPITSCTVAVAGTNASLTVTARGATCPTGQGLYQIAGEQVSNPVVCQRQIGDELITVHDAGLQKAVGSRICNSLISNGSGGFTVTY